MAMDEDDNDDTDDDDDDDDEEDEDGDDDDEDPMLYQRYVILSICMFAYIPCDRPQHFPQMIKPRLDLI